jgi:hypothetical protein
LRWLNKHNSHYSAISQIQTTTIASYISSSKSILLLIGTNSIRSLPAALVLNQVKDFILLLRNHHPHLVDKASINIVAIFPCRKTSFSFPTYTSLQQNINSYNQGLSTLSNDLNFTILDFKVEDNHLSPDNIHIHYDHRGLVENSIFNYFNSINSKVESPSIRTDHLFIADLERRNERKHEKLDQKQKLHQLKRSKTPSWTVDHVKEFLKQKQIKFGKIPPIYKNIIRIRFNNFTSLQEATKALPQDIFSEETFFQFFSV